MASWASLKREQRLWYSATYWGLRPFWFSDAYWGSSFLEDYCFGMTFRMPETESMGMVCFLMKMFVVSGLVSGYSVWFSVGAWRLWFSVGVWRLPGEQSWALSLVSLLHLLVWKTGACFSHLTLDSPLSCPHSLPPCFVHILPRLFLCLPHCSRFVGSLASLIFRKPFLPVLAVLLWLLTWSDPLRY